ncbi:MAG: TetR/AcrR family transcriptional regulator [Clostridia bacterium]|nr:TetR/AcrR family transcriptional regulator [Clostridia bacterium]
MAKKEKTKDKIIRVSTRMFLEYGYSATTVQMVCSELGISKGNYRFYFSSKDDILAVLVEMLCEFQRKLMAYEAGEGISSLLSICLELMSMAAACEESEVAKDFFISTYQSPKCLEIIHNNDTARAKEVFAEYCSDWTDEQFREAEILVSGIEYATLNAIDESVPLETRISGALNTIMTIYNVPEEIRGLKIEKVLAMDYCSIGKRIFNEFKEYVERMQNSE